MVNRAIKTELKASFFICMSKIISEISMHIIYMCKRGPHPAYSLRMRELEHVKFTFNLSRLSILNTYIYIEL